MRCLAILTVFLLLPVALFAQTLRPQTRYAKIRLTKGRASEVRSQIIGSMGREFEVFPNWWDPNFSPLPPGTTPNLPKGILSITAYDVDNTLIVRYTSEEALHAFEEQIKPLDVQPAAILLKVRAIPVLRRPTEEDAAKALPAKKMTETVVQQLLISDNDPFAFGVAPNAFGEKYSEVLSSTLPERLETLVYVTPHLNSNGSISLLCLLSYRDGDHKTRVAHKVYYGDLKEKRALVVLPVEDARYPVEFYLLEVFAEEQKQQADKADKGKPGDG
jgi:hypothetical protein